MKKIYTIILLCSLTGLMSCKKGKDPETESRTTVLKKEAIANYAAIVHASYSDALAGAVNLQTKINAFVTAPDAAKLQACKTAWLEARTPYNQTEPYRFYNGPIDDDNGPEGVMNAWPLDEVYIDYVSSNATSGIINDPTNFPTISSSVIEGLNEVGGETNIATGYHALEFLLWGQDLDANGPGTRPYTDYSTASNFARRGQYLQACADLLVDNLQYVVDAWAPSVPANYRATFVAAAPDESLKKILQGIGFFSKGEMAGERMAVALSEQLQEHEHSCFSDNTTNDIQEWSKGIQNVYLGSYVKTDGTTVQGTSVNDVLAFKHADLAAEITTAIAYSVTNCNAIPAPFDQQIIGGASSAGGVKIQTAITSLRAQADKIAEAASVLGLGNITVE